MSGRYYVQHVIPSLTSGAGGTAPGGGRRRLLSMPDRSLLQTPDVNASTTAGQATLVTLNLNKFLSGAAGRRKLLQTSGLEIVYACVLTVFHPPACPTLGRWALSACKYANVLCMHLVHTNHV